MWIHLQCHLPSGDKSAAPSVQGCACSAAPAVPPAAGAYSAAPALPMWMRLQCHLVSIHTIGASLCGFSSTCCAICSWCVFSCTCSANIHAPAAPSKFLNPVDRLTCTPWLQLCIVFRPQAGGGDSRASSPFLSTARLALEACFGFVSLYVFHPVGPCQTALVIHEQVSLSEHRSVSLGDLLWWLAPSCSAREALADHPVFGPS